MVSNAWFSKVPAVSLVVAFALILVVAGCAPSAPSPGAPAASTAPPPAAAVKEKPAEPAKPQPAALKKVVFADGSLTPTRWPLWVAVEESLFKKYGLDFQFVQMDGAPAATQAVVGRQAQFTMGGAPSPITAAAAGAPIKIIATLQTKADVNFVVKPGIDSPAKLKGAKVGISSFGALTHMTAFLMLESLGLDPEKDVAYIQIGNDAALAAALQAGSIDAAAINPTATSQVRRALGVKPLIEGKNSDFSFPGTNLYTLIPIVQSDPEMVKGVLKGFLDGLDWVHDPANKTKVLAVMQKYMKLKPDDPSLEESYQLYVTGRLFHVPPRVFKEGFQKVKDFSAKFNEKAKDVNLDQTLDTSLLDAVLAERKR